MSNTVHIHDDEDKSVEFLDISASSPDEFTEELLNSWFTEIHESGDTTINIVHKEQMGERTVYVVRVETIK